MFEDKLSQQLIRQRLNKISLLLQFIVTLILIKYQLNSFLLLMLLQFLLLFLLFKPLVFYSYHFKEFFRAEACVYDFLIVVPDVVFVLVYFYEFVV